MVNASKAADEEGFQEEPFKQGLHAMDNHLADLFNHVAYTGVPQSWSHHIIQPIHKSGSSTNPNNYKIIMVGYTFPNSMPQSSIQSSLGSLRGGNLELGDRLDFDLNTNLLITSSHFRPSLRRHDIALRAFIVVLWTFRNILTPSP
jgi:hypothetical protein